MVVWWKLVHFSIRLPYKGPCQQQPCWLLQNSIGYGGEFRKLLPGCVYNSNIFAPPGKQQPSSPLCVSLWSNEFPQRAHSRFRNLLCATQSLGSHTKLNHRWLAPHHLLPALSGDTSFPPWHVGWRGERLAAYRTEPCTPVRERKAVTNENRISDDRRRRWTDLPEAPPTRWLDVHDRGRVAGNQ